MTVAGTPVADAHVSGAESAEALRRATVMLSRGLDSVTSPPASSPALTARPSSSAADVTRAKAARSCSCCCCSIWLVEAAAAPSLPASDDTGGGGGGGGGSASSTSDMKATASPPVSADATSVALSNAAMNSAAAPATST